MSFLTKNLKQEITVWKPSFIQSNILTLRVQASADDVTHRNNHLFDPVSVTFFAGSVTSSISFDSAARFINVTIPNAAKIKTANLILVADQDQSGTPVLTLLHLEDIDNSTQIVDDSDWHTRILTEGIPWNNLPAWSTDEVISSASIVVPLQSIVDKTTWLSGNAVTVFWINNNSGDAARRSSNSYDNSVTKAPELSIEYTIKTTDPVRDGFGNLTYQSPKIIKGRWEENSDLKFDLAGREVIPEAVVFLKEDVEEGDFLLLGADSTASPTPTTEASEVRKFRKIPTLNRHHFERVAFL